MAHPSACSPAANDRNLQPVALRRRDRATRPQAGTETRLVGTVRADQRLRAYAYPEFRRHPQVLSTRLARRAEEAADRPIEGQKKELEVSRGRSRRSGVMERIHDRLPR